MSGDEPEQRRSADPRSDGGTGRSSASVDAAEADPDPADAAGTDPVPTDAERAGRTADLWGTSAAEAASDGVPYELDVYAGLLDALAARGYEFVGFDGAIENGQIALRHDVDISLERAAEMARIESALGVTATYFVLVTNPLYDLLAPENRRRIGTIVGAGHDVGLHFDPHYYWDEEPAAEDLEARVAADRAALERAIETAAGDVPASATSIHQPPDWVLGADFGGFESTYQPRYFHDVAYVSDSGGKWRGQRPFAEGVPDAMQLLVHPGLWQHEDRPMAAILEDQCERCHERIERYVGPFGG